jgi:nicotinate dehydrogenase subunit B
MTTLRRDFLKAGGALIVGFPLRGLLHGQERGTIAGPPDAKQVDTWLAIHADNTATVYIGFAELGQGASTALLQVAAEELDMDMSQIKTVRLDTNVTPNQGGTYSSAAIARGGPQVRTAAAEARAALLRMASKKLDTPVDQLTVSRGIVSVSGNPSRSIKYGELLGEQPFHLAFTGNAPIKPPSEYKIVGKDIPRNEVPDIVSGQYTYMQHVRVPGMLHGRLVRPRGQSAYGMGAKVLMLDESSIRDIPGTRVLRRGDFVGVVAENEWDAIRAARQLKVTWDTTPGLPGINKLHQHMRASATTDRVVVERGDVTAAIKQAAHAVAHTYHCPYQAHAPFGPNCALAQVTADSALVMCSTQDVYGTRNTLSRVLNLPIAKIRVQYYEGSGTYGHSCYDDAAQSAALLSQLAAAPVRVQFMRWDEHGWDNYGPAHIGEVRAAIDANGKLVAYQYDGWHHNWSAVETAAQLAGTPAAEWNVGAAQQVNPMSCGGMYDIANVRLVNHQLPAKEYLKGAWLRSPLDLSFAFASEQTIDELAHLAAIDPYDFRRSNIKDARWLGVLDAVAKSANWAPRRSKKDRDRQRLVTGRGIGLGTHLASYGAAVADVEVEKETGRVTIRRLFGAIDCGLAVNPGFIENQISGQLVQTASRMLHEEVTFNTTNVTSLDWNSYPILRFEECPEVHATVVQRLNERSSGAGEEVMAATAAAIANAFYDATGTRMREFPMTPKRVLAALGGNTKI